MTLITFDDVDGSDFSTSDWSEKVEIPLCDVASTRFSASDWSPEFVTQAVKVFCGFDSVIVVDSVVVVVVVIGDGV